MSSTTKALSLTGIAITISILASLSLTIVIINNYTTNITTIITNIAARINQLENQTIPAPTPTPIPCGTNNYNGTCIPPPVNNNQSNTTIPIPLPSTCEPNEHLVNNICIPNTPTPTPTPIPTPIPQPTTDMKVLITGDVASGTAGSAVFNQIKKQNATNVIVLGDLGYASDLKWFKSTYGTLGNKLNCVIGNHDSTEDGTSSIFKEAQAYCGDSYYFKKNHVLFMGFDTNGDLNTQATEAGKLLTNPTFMNSITSVHILSHKPCAVPPNAHHPLEIKTFCDVIKSKIPSTVKAYYDQAHNHVMSSSADGTYKEVGAGGKSHYTCGTNTEFPFCDNAHFGFLEYIIKPDGTTTSKFIDSNGSEVTGIK